MYIFGLVFWIWISNHYILNFQIVYNTSELISHFNFWNYIIYLYPSIYIYQYWIIKIVSIILEQYAVCNYYFIYFYYWTIPTKIFFFGLKLNCLHNILYTRFSTLTEELRDSENVIIVTLNTSLIRSEMDFKTKLTCCLLELSWNARNSQLSHLMYE